MAKYCESLGILTFALSLASILKAVIIEPPSFTEISISPSDTLWDTFKVPVLLTSSDVVIELDTNNEPVIPVSPATKNFSSPIAVVPVPIPTFLSL